MGFIQFDLEKENKKRLEVVKGITGITNNQDALNMIIRKALEDLNIKKLKEQIKIKKIKTIWE